MGSITFDSVRKVYDQEIVAVKDFNLEIRDGEFLTLVGPSGSGKSTLLRMVAGLEDITSGTIKIGDEIVNKLPPRNRDIAMVFQSYALYPHLTVRDNMAFGLRRSTDLSNDEIQERVKDAAKMMGIDELLDNKPKQLSGGQRQRVATGRAIVREPGVFLFDEPLSNLDAKLRKHMRIELQRLQEELETTSIYVTHDQEEAMTMSDRIAILNHGELQQVGTPREVYTHPQNTFVAQFIGSPSMNMFNVTFEGDSQGGQVTSDEHNFSIKLQPDQAKRLHNEGNQNNEYILGIRPEHISVSHEHSQNSLRAYIDIIEPLGDQDLLYFTFDRESDSILTEESPDEQTNSRDEENKAYIQPNTFSNTDEDIYLEFDLDQAHFFDGETQERVKMPSTVEAKPAGASETTNSTS